MHLYLKTNEVRKASVKYMYSILILYLEFEYSCPLFIFLIMNSTNMASARNLKVKCIGLTVRRPSDESRNVCPVILRKYQ